MVDPVNWAARASRSLVKLSRADTSVVFLIATILLGGAWILFTTWGVLIADRSSDRAPFPLLGDITYACLTFLSPSPEFIHAGGLPWQWEVGRNSALALTLLGLLKLLQRLAGPFIARILTRHFASGHDLIVSTDGQADSIAIANSFSNHPTVLADTTLPKDGERVEMLARAGVIAVRGKSLADMTKRSARMRATRNVAVWEATDTGSLATALSLRKECASSVAEIAVRIASPMMQQSLRAAPKLLERTADDCPRLRPISQIGSSARSALASAELIHRSREKGHQKVSALLIGGGMGLHWIADFILRQNWALGLGGPRLDIIGEAKDWTDWLHARESFLHQLHHVFDPDLFPEVETHFEGRKPLHEVAQTTIVAFVDLGDDDRTLSYAVELATRVVAERWPFRVRAVLRDYNALTDFVGAVEMPFDPPIVHSRVGELSEIFCREADADAARIHLAYAARNGASRFGGTGWDQLPETILHSNRSAADHAAIKLADLNLIQPVSDDDWIALGRIEHARWSIDKLLDGWRLGDRDMGRLKHPNLVPWEALDEITREKDIAPYHQLHAKRSVMASLEA